ncbi:MAG: 4-(cytidine 5'-diphospho)-2-C-methyl-D-erythritol kinase [Kiloniellaceae bacterium]
MTDASETGAGGNVVEHAWAKVNLTLQVTGRRADGYHELESLVVFADVGDVLTIEPVSTNSLNLTVMGPQAGPLLHEHDNLVLLAAQALTKRTGINAGAEITLTKNLPVASGIGGGSADAAAALRGLARLWQADLSAAEMEALALTLGADVPVCLRGEAAIMSGIGEQLQPLPALPPLWLLLVNPGVAVSTPAVFRALSGAYSRVREPRLPPIGLAAFVDWLVARGNDLQAPACGLAPAVTSVLAALEESPDCLLARMSGSGATCFGLFENEAAARRAAAVLVEANPDWWVAPALLRA